MYSSSDDDDPFFSGGFKSHVSAASIYANDAAIDDLASGESEPAAPSLLSQPRNGAARRGRGSKSNKRGRPAARGSRTAIDVTALEDGDGVVDVIDVDADDDDDAALRPSSRVRRRGAAATSHAHTLGAGDLTTKQALSRARRAKLQADDDDIEREVEREAQSRREAQDRAEAAAEAERKRAASAAAAAAAAAAGETGDVPSIRSAMGELGDGSASSTAAQQIPEAELIILRVRSNRKHSIEYRIKRKDPVRKMLQPFCKHFDIDISTATMQVDGDDVGENETPEDLDLENKMVVDVRLR